MSLLGNYETASVYYQGVIQQIHRLLATIEDPGRKFKWQQIQGEVAQEYDVVKNITQTLALFKGKIKTSCSEIICLKRSPLLSMLYTPAKRDPM